jgi:hypothetical protein
LVVAVAAAFAGAAGAKGSPAVTVTNMRPVTIAGRGFVPGERVRVVVYSKRIETRTVIATRRGRFVARYPVAVGDCTGIRVVARGNRGSRASYAITQTCEPAPR